jgi:hypothetical protein
MVKMYPLNAVSHNVAVYKNVSTMLNEKLCATLAEQCSVDIDRQH